MAEMTVICFKETDAEKWVAQCLEYDICASADSLAELPGAFDAAVEGHKIISEAEGLEALTWLPEAPQRYRKMFQEAVIGVFEPRTARLPVRMTGTQTARAQFSLATA